MKIITAILFFALFVVACKKENDINTQVNSQPNINEVNTAANIPINDLGADTFNGYVGGLFPNGLNYPTGTYANDLLRTCQNIVPLDTFGNPSDNGKILFISLGWSTGGQNMKELQTKTVGNPLTDPHLSLLS